ncbi:exocyst complex component 6B-like [Babylonia areolata]|uniref:exocyst complex component 6B-like n=1 Tax=Babylonia areolata TaxID=304850 RepID=UPI003FD4BC8A
MMAEATPKTDNPWKQLSVPVQDAGALRQEAIDAHHDHLITEIETSEGPLATTLRAVYDGDDVEQFQEKLEDRIKSHDRDIERMCNYHYQGFIDSVRELQQVGGDAASLKTEIKHLDGELQKSCGPLLEIGDKLIKCRRVQKNITQAVENLSLCLPVLEMYGKLQEQMKNKRYYPALKTLEQLEHTYLPRVMTHWFSQTMADAIPKLRQQIQEASMSELKDFLESIRKHSTKIGEVAMKHAAEQNNMDPTIAKKRVKKRRAPPPPNPFTGEVDHPPEPSIVDDDEEEDELSAQDLVDFSPVYRCLHIYAVLGDRDEFEFYYRQQRWKQARLSLQTPHNMHESIEAFKKYFHDVVGFFVVEDHILHTTQGLVTRSHMDELWEKAVEKMSSTLRSTAARLVTKPNWTSEEKLTGEFRHAIPEALEEELELDAEELIQISINMNYLERSCPHLEAYISSLTGAEKDSVHVARLHGTSMFKDARSDAEQHIYQQLNAKIDEFMDLAAYDWTLMESKGHPSSYISDLMAFLQSTFMSFTNLPVFHQDCTGYIEKVAKTACMSACQHIASRLMGFLLDNEIRQLSMGALQQFNLDIMECEQFANSEFVPGSNDGTLQLAFSDLRQLMDLFINWDWSVYLADFGKQQARYLRVQRHIAISLLEKLNNADKKKNNLFASLKKNERDKKKLVDTVLKQLRALETSNTPQG